MAEELLRLMDRYRLMAIVRLCQETYLEAVVETLVEEGVKILEITANTPGFLEAISRSRIRFPNLLLGAGTITNPGLAEKAIEAGAQFLVSPNTHGGIAQVAHRQRIPIMMGALTPTEVALAIEFGADLIKLYPAGFFGIEYYKALKGPFNKASFIAVGGIGRNNIRDWLDTGITGVALGNSLVPFVVDSRENLEEIRTRVSEFKILSNH